MKPIYLGVNIDHVATLRQARGTKYPDPVYAAYICEQAGADGITLHLREDRRHIQERDVLILADTLETRMNFEMALTDEMLAFAEKINPAHVCLVPEKRTELTTEGGLDVIAAREKIRAAIERLSAKGIDVSLFIDPEPAQIEASIDCGAPTIELHTGAYADAHDAVTQQRELARVQRAIDFAKGSNIVINCGHGLHYHNVADIAKIPEVNELNIGHGIVARAIFSGLATAVSDMKRLMIEARTS